MGTVTSMRMRTAAGLTCAALGMLALAGAAGASRGTIVVATCATNAHVRGADVELVRAIANALGYRVRIVDASQDAILPGLASGELDLGMSLADTPARERAVDVVTYRSAPGRVLYGIAAPKGSELTGEVIGALRMLVADGTYRGILAKWGVRTGAVAAPRLDPAGA